MNVLSRYIRLILTVFPLFVAAFLSSCGGGGTATTATNTGSTITSYFVDGPTKGVTYACSPSGLSGVTSATGSFTCQAGDSVSLSLNVGATTIHLGTIAVPGISGVSIPVTTLPNGLQIASVLLALNHGTSANIDVSGLTLPSLVAAQITNYISSGGTLPSGQGSDDQFLAYVQSQATAGAAFVMPVSGTGKTFQQDTVLPHLQDTIIAISATNPALQISNNTTKLSGTMLVTGSGTIPAVSGCTSGTWKASGGGILNATVAGNIQQAGTYSVTFSSPGFVETISYPAITCTSGTTSTTIPAQTISSTVPPFSGVDTITVTPAFSGNSLTLGSNGTPPSGCSGGNVTGTDLGLSNPMITLSTSMSCAMEGATATVSVTAKMVGAW